MSDRVGLSKQDAENLKRYRHNKERQLIESKQYLQYIEALRKSGQIPTTLIAFEIIKTLHNGMALGYSNSKVLSVLPNEIGNETIAVPVAALRALITAWDDFKYSFPADMNISFALRSDGNGRNPLTKLEKLKNDRYYTRCMIEMRTLAKLDGKKLTVARAAEEVAAENSVSVQTVKTAYSKHRNDILKVLSEYGVEVT